MPASKHATVFELFDPNSFVREYFVPVVFSATRVLMPFRPCAFILQARTSSCQR